MKKYKLNILLTYVLIIIVTLTGCKGKEQEAFLEQAIPVETMAEDIEVPSGTDGIEEEQAVSKHAVIHFIDTGNSDAILIQGVDYAILIDGGDNDDETFLPQYIKEQGITSIDYVIATHPDADHIGGLDGVIREFEIGQVLVSNGDADTKTYRDFIQAMMDKGVMPSVPLRGSVYELGDASFEVLSVATASDPNNCSIVILYTHGEDRLLFMGDAGREIERELDVAEVDLIKIGHHGSKTSSDPDFIEQVVPKYAVITVGDNNKYGHPHKETMSTLEKLNIPVYRTDEGGTICFNSTGSGVETNAFPNSYASPQSAEISQTEDSSQIQVTGTVNDEVVYFTENGKKYHKIENCSNMKVPIRGSLSDVGDREPCKKCYGD